MADEYMLRKSLTAATLLLYSSKGWHVYVVSGPSNTRVCRQVVYEGGPLHVLLYSLTSQSKNRELAGVIRKERNYETGGPLYNEMRLEAGAAYLISQPDRRYYTEDVGPVDFIFLSRRELTAPGDLEKLMETGVQIPHSIDQPNTSAHSGYIERRRIKINAAARAFSIK